MTKEMSTENVPDFNVLKIVFFASGKYAFSTFWKICILNMENIFSPFIQNLNLT
jgi:hypothetical protein